MIKRLYKDYFQKSHTFLFPMLGFKRKSIPFRPLQTYISWEKHNITSEDCKLVCVYEKNEQEAWRTYESNILLNHPMLDFVDDVDDEKIAYVFDFHCYKNDFISFTNGKYSKLSADARKLISDYYGIHTPEWVYMESFLYPKKYFASYAEMLLVEVATLQKVGELCDKLNLEKETLNNNSYE
jgi:hypothetical protein